MERLLGRMRAVGIVPCAATFLEALESFSFSNGSEERLTESTLEVPAFDDDDDDGHGVDAFEGNMTSDILTLSNY
jgi:hypothetical protein